MRSIGSLTALAATLAASFACTADVEDDGIVADTRANLTEGRSFEVIPAGAPEATVVVIGDPATSATFDAFEDYLTAECSTSASARFAAVTQPAPAGCDLSREVKEQQVALCIGHRWATLAGTVAPVDIFGDGRVEVRRPLEPGERPSELEAELDGADRRFTVPVPSNNAAATFALLATEAFRRAGLLGAGLLDTARCPDGFLAQPVAADAPGSGSTDTVSLAFVVSAATTEAAFTLHETAKTAEARLQAAAQSRLSEQPDQRRALYESWAAAHNSRAEVLAMWAGLPEPQPAQWPGTPSCPPGGPPCEPNPTIPYDPPTGQLSFPVDTCRTPDDDDGEAIRILRAVRIDPRTGIDASGGTTRTPDDLLRDVRDAMIEDFPAAFAGTETMSPAEWIDTHTNTTSDAILRAAGHLVEEERVRGRVIRVARRSADLMVPRVVGTAEGGPRSDPAFLFARTSGAARFDDTEDLAREQARRRGRGVLADAHFAPESYGERGVLPALDVIRGALSISLRRTDMQTSGGATAGEPEPGSPLYNAWTGIELARDLVPMRLQVAVGRPTTGGVDQVRLRLYGGRTEVDRDGDGATEPVYSVWVGEAGLQCATTGSVEGESCVPSEHRVDLAPRIVVDGANTSGLGEDVLEWTILPAMLPGRPSAIPEDTRLYVTAKHGTRERSVAGIAPTAGPRTGSYSRISYMPAGHGAQAASTSAIDPSTDRCDRPRLCCGNLPCDLRLPLENELTEAREGRDEIESSFDHYLRVAREAADRADALGRELVESGLEMDVRAEAAAQELETLCGGVVNVGGLGPRLCPGNTADECCSTPPCGAEVACNNGLCEYDDPLDAIEATSPDHASIAKCLGDDSREAISLGDRELCYYEALDGSLPPCDCGEMDCPACPIFAPSVGGCDSAFPTLDAMVFGSHETVPMFKSVADADGFDAPDCLALARIRNAHQHPPGDAVDELLAQEWVSMAHVWAMGETLGYRPDLFQMGAITRSGAPWLRTGSVADGPETDDTFPCGPHSSLSEDDRLEYCTPLGDEWPAGRPLICGIDLAPGEDTDGCSDRTARTRHNMRLMRAVEVLAALGGASGRYLQRPAYRGDGTGNSYGMYVHDTPDAFGRQTYMPGATGCENDVPDEFSHGPLCWIREHSEVGNDFLDYDLFFPRFCGSDGDVETWGCPHFFPGLPSGATALPSQPVPGWFAAEHGTGFIHRFYDGEGGGHNPHTTALPDTEASCVMLAGTPTDEVHMATGAALCPTYFTRAPGSLDFMDEHLNGLSRTDPERLIKFWSKFGGWSDGSQTIRTLLEGIADESLVVHGVNTVVLDELPDGQVTNGQLLDALELACLSAYENGGGCPADLNELPEVSSVSDFRALERLLECAATRLEYQLEQMILFDVPATVASDLASGQNTATYPTNRGQMGVTVAQLRGAVETVNVVTRQVASTLRDFGAAMQVAQAQLEVEDLESQLAVNQAAATTSSQLARCASAMTGTKALDNANPWHWAQAAIECADAAAQIGLAWQAAKISEEIDDLQQQQIFLQLAQTFGQSMDGLAAATSLLAESYAEINSLLATMDMQRTSASRAMATVLFLDSDAVGREYNVNRVMRARHTTLRIRYERARDKAIRLAWIARIGLEQKLGVELHDLTSDMTLVDAPATWVDRVCTMPAIDYDEIRDVTTPGGPNVNYADAFIGDYVDMLESVKESYPFDFPFTDAHDTTILSLRDGIMGAVALCNAPGPNLLHHAADPSTMKLDGIGGWTPSCDIDGYCVAVTPTGESPFTTESIQNENGDFDDAISRALGGAMAQRMEVLDSEDPPADPGAFDPSWSQALTLDDGTYLLSWYEKLDEPPIAGGECGAVVEPMETLLVPSVQGLAEQPLIEIHSTGPYVAVTEEPWLHSCWRRAWVVIRNPVPQDVRVGLAVREAPVMAPFPTVDFAAPQLEVVPPEELADLMSVTPRPFFPTDDSLEWPVALCEDTFGDVFRAEGWSSGCVELCPDGFADVCTTGSASTHCYHEMQFAITLPEIESGQLLSSGSFALGNFNYRHEELAVNLVGVGIRDCELTDRPSVCNADGTLQYSVRHDGPYRVRNHQGEVYDAPLFVGHIEHGRALASERYLSNPLSSADEALLARSQSRELEGRPLDGHYTLRIWHDPSLVWDRVQDVQIALKYRYWTRFE